MPHLWLVLVPFTTASSLRACCVRTQVHFNTPFTAEFGPHEQLLRKLWQSAYPKARMVRVSPKWQRLGFQQSDPSTDFRGGGVLSLKCLVYMAENYPVPVRVLCDDQRVRVVTHRVVVVAACLGCGTCRSSRRSSTPRRRKPVGTIQWRLRPST